MYVHTSHPVAARNAALYACEEPTRELEESGRKRLKNDICITMIR